MASGGLKGGLKGAEGGASRDEFYFHPQERLRVAFSFLWSGEHVFFHFFTA